MRRDWIVALGVLAVIIAGCNQGSQPSDEADATSATPASGVAIIDLDEVARQLGRDVRLVDSIRQGQASVAQQLQTYQSSLQKEFKEKVLQLNADPAAATGDEEARQKQLADLQRRYSAQLNQTTRNAQKELKAHEQKLVQQFREEVKPVARQVAAERGLGVVVTKNESVLLTFDETHDITAAVVAKLRPDQPAAGAKQTATSSNRSTATAPLRR